MEKGLRIFNKIVSEITYSEMDDKMKILNMFKLNMPKCDSASSVKILIHSDLSLKIQPE
jgi:hypothetical protein